MNRMKKRICGCLLALAVGSVSAQDLGVGFKAGLNFNTFRGPTEQSSSDQSSERFDLNTGFHVGATLTYEATDLMGARVELLFTQKGGRRSYEGPSYYRLLEADRSSSWVSGMRKMDVSVNHSYLDIPLAGYFRPVPFLEVYAGGSVGVLLSATGFGELRFGGSAQTFPPLPEFSHELDANFLSDVPGEVRLTDPPATISYQGKTYVIPQAAGAYFEFGDDPGKLYRRLDAGVLGGLSVFLNGSLYVSGRMYYGLLDVTRTQADVSLRALDTDGNLVRREDDDRLMSLQCSIGFSF
ncbi:MAG: hypothetical protein RLY31_882 [Bacteroidota bacterium]